MTTLSCSFLPLRTSPDHDCKRAKENDSLLRRDQCLGSGNLCISTTYRGQAKLPKSGRLLTVQARVDDGSSSPASIFVSGFVLGGLVVGALGCIYAPQISTALAADRKDLMRKLPKFIYDEEKALERTRQVLTEKIAQLNEAIDDVSAQLRAGDTPNGTAVNADELESSV